jgi:prepilin-type N-terminal cleavage/methylation domain-containing protein
MKIIMKSSAGFTLIEVIASLVVMGIVAAVAGMGLVRGIQAYTITRTSTEAVQRAEYAVNRIKQELMNMDTVTAAGPDTITFTSNFTTDYPGRNDGTAYTFTRVGNQINLTVTPLVGAASTNALITGLGTYATGLFSYQSNTDIGNNNTWAIAQLFNTLKTVNIQLIIARSDGAGDLTFTTSVNPRNNGLADGPQAVSLTQ